MADPVARFVKIRDGLTPKEWLRVGGMAVTIIGLNVLGWGMLVAATSGHYHINKTELFGSAPGCWPTPWACAMPLTPTTSPRSTTPPAS